MKYLDPSRQVLIPVILSLRADTAALLEEMSCELGVSLDEVVSQIAEDSVIGLESKNNFIHDVVIPDSVSYEDLMRAFESK